MAGDDHLELTDSIIFNQAHISTTLYPAAAISTASDGANVHRLCMLCAHSAIAHAHAPIFAHQYMPIVHT
jgi:hypothetical protein